MVSSIELGLRFLLLKTPVVKTMVELITSGITVFIALFAMMNPAANAPVFISLTEGMKSDEKRTIALRSNIISFFIVSSFCLMGRVIFDAFGITIPAFRIAGGILIFLIGRDMLNGDSSEVHTPTQEDNAKSLEAELSISVCPLAIPILAGPGIIASTMSYVSDKGFSEAIFCIISMAILNAINYFFFVSGERFLSFIGESAIKVISRMMGLVLAVMGVQMIIRGVYGAMHLNL